MSGTCFALGLRVERSGGGKGSTEVFVSPAGTERGEGEMLGAFLGRVAAVLFGGFGLLAYVILWIVLPEGEASSSSAAARIVEERFARGEIDAEEMRRLKEDLTR